MTIRVSAWPESAVLCRILGTFAQLQLPAPQVQVNASDDSMTIAIQALLGQTEAICIARKIRATVGVEEMESSLDAAAAG